MKTRCNEIRRMIQYNRIVIEHGGITMTEIVKKAWAGTLESSDAYVEVEPAQDLTIELQSVV